MSSKEKIRKRIKNAGSIFFPLIFSSLTVLKPLVTNGIARIWET